jgi:hypothetical protein
VSPVNAESVTIGPFSLGNRILQFFLKFQIVLQFDQAQTMWASQGMARCSSSLKYSHVRASTESASTYFNDSTGESIFSGMAHYGMEIYNDTAIMPSIYVNPDVRYANYLPTPQTYNINLVGRSHIGMASSFSHVNVHNSYSSTDISRWSNHNAYIFDHVSNIHNEFVPPLLID